MTKAKNFERFFDHLIDIVIKNNTTNDVDLMSNLRFSPPSWKVWKQKFIEKSNITYWRDDITKFEYKITYDGKRKVWFKESVTDYRKRIQIIS